ncbi:MAG: hypothetical protein ABIR80_05425, partial [Opitutaceae bacterium]
RQGRSSRLRFGFGAESPVCRSGYLLSREAQGKSLLDEYHEQKQALSKYCIGALILTEPVLAMMRRELKRLSPDR